MKLKILTLNTAIQDVRILGRSVYRPVPYVDERLAALPGSVLDIDADIVGLQELFHRRNQDWLHQQLQHRYPYACGFAEKKFSPSLGNELFVLSKFPITSASTLHRFRDLPFEERWFTYRGFLRANLLIPQLGTVHLLNFHMTAGGHSRHPETPEMESLRSRQITQVLSHASHLSPALLFGDLNAGPQSSVENYQAMLSAGLIDMASGYGEANITWDPGNPLVSAGSEAGLPAQRIDHVFADAHLNSRIAVTESRIVLNEACVNTQEGNTPISDHYGLLVEFEC